MPLSIDEQMNQSLAIIAAAMKQAICNKQADISLGGGNFAPGRPFLLYVGVEGNVVGLDAQGVAVNRHFIVGYHPVVMTQVTALGTDATDLAALYF